LHFNSHHSLIQWTAGIRLAMFEHTTLQEAYTGALIAGKGKALNNISLIMERTKIKTEDWARVRFGAGTPWRRCWCVITPPPEKEVQKLQKQVNKKKSAYDRSRPPVLKGEIKFYDSKKTKKATPIATIKDAYSAFAIYPQAKPLIDASTLVKVEGSITIHSDPPSTTEGFVFVMPEVHPAVSGFEMMLRWLFPVFDTFALYGRPTRLIADTTNPESLMFAMPKHRRYGYLEILDVSGLVLEQGSSEWKESEWRRRMKELVSKRMTAIENGSRTTSRYGSRRSVRNSYGPSRSRIHFDDGASIKSSPPIGWAQSQAEPPYGTGIPRTDSAPPGSADLQSSVPHYRSVSDTHAHDRYASASSNFDGAYEQGPLPLPHSLGGSKYTNEMGTTPERVSSEEDEQTSPDTPVPELQDLRATGAPEPVAAPPAFSHGPGSLPPSKPYQSPELRRANSRMSTGTLSLLAGGAGAGSIAAAFHSNGEGLRSDEQRLIEDEGPDSEDRGQTDQRGVLPEANKFKSPANSDGLYEGSVTASILASFDGSLPSPRPLDLDPRTNSSQPYHSSYTPSTPQPGDARDHASINRTYDPPQAFASSDPNIQATWSPQPSSMQGHIPQRSTDSTRSVPSQPPRLQTRESIIRKPVPTNSSSVVSPVSAETPSSSGSLAQHVLDQAAFDLIGKPSDRKLTLLPDRDRSNTATSVYPEDIRDDRPTLLPPIPPMPDLRDRSNTGISVYEDDIRSDDSEPDYASTSSPSIDTQKSVEKPRAGVLRTVGTVENDGGSNSPILDIDFGPTLNLVSDRAPLQRNPVGGESPGPSQMPGAERAPSRTSPSPGPAPAAGHRAHSSLSSRNITPPDGAHYRNESGESRTLAWQPGMSAIGSSSPGFQRAITPEKFVQQRAAATPLYAHQRQTSANTLRSTPTPPLVRNRSSDLLGPQGHSRQSSSVDLLTKPGHSRQNSSIDLVTQPRHSRRSSSIDLLAQQGHSRRSSSIDLLQRPSSRGASVALSPLGNGASSSGLSARDHAYIAKLTGQPLINMAHNNRQDPPSTGLLSAIEVRERENRQFKESINSLPVIQAVAQQQQQTQYQLNAEYVPQSPYGGMGQYPQMQYSDQSQRQQQWISPAANVFAQGGGWSAPVRPGTPGTPQRESYFPYSPPPPQFFANPEFPQQQGWFNAGYHGGR
jgi:CCR4-NOT transcriptional complex subunit CAF120